MRVGPHQCLDAIYKFLEHGIGGVLLPFDDEEVALVSSTAMDYQIRPEPVIATTIRSRGQTLRPIQMPFVVEINHECVLRGLQGGCHVDTETMYKLQRVSA